MPVEIKELIIHAEVSDHKTAEKGTNNLTQTDWEKEKSTIIEECVELVMAILQKQKER